MKRRRRFAVLFGAAAVKLGRSANRAARIDGPPARHSAADFVGTAEQNEQWLRFITSRDIRHTKTL